MAGNLAEVGASVASKADVDWSKAMEAKIRAEVSASADSEEMKSRRCVEFRRVFVTWTFVRVEADFRSSIMGQVEAPAEDAAREALNYGRIQHARQRHLAELPRNLQQVFGVQQPAGWV